MSDRDDYVGAMVRRMTIRFGVMLHAATIYQTAMLTIFLLLLAR